MNTSISRKRTHFGIGAALALTAASLVVACGDDENDGGTTTIPGTGGSRATGGGPGNEGGESGARASTGGTSGAGGDNGATGGIATTAGADSGGSSGAGSGEGGAGGAGSCQPEGELDCYPCAPATNEQFLNQCSDAECAPFDNAERIPGFDGTLPDL
jgi:hypothetical protein